MAAARATIFGLHPLAVEDALTRHQRPKVEPYDDMLFLVLKTLWYVDERDEVETGQVSMFLGADFVVTVRQGAGVELAERPPRPGAQGAPARARARPRSSTRSATGSSTATRTSPRELETDVDEVEASVFSPERDPGLAAHLRAQAGDRRGPPRGARRCAAPMQRFAATAYPFLHDDSGAVLPRHRRPRRRGSRRRSTPSTSCCRRPSRRTSPGSACSRTRTCGRSRRGWRSPVSARWSPASTA